MLDKAGAVRLLDEGMDKISLVWNSANETYYMFYNGVDNKGRGIGLIISKPLISMN